MVSFLALYRGASLESAELVSVSTDPELVAFVAGALLKKKCGETGDPALAALRTGRRRALNVLRRQGRDVAGGVADEPNGRTR
jgi:hypothetical protein